MYPILYDSITLGSVPQHNGLGVLSDCHSCVVEHERNGIYECTFEYSMDGIHSQDIAYMRFIKAKPNFTDDPQLFYIDRIGKEIGGKFTVYCKHISYLLSGFDITSGTASNAVQACNLLQNASQGFSISTDKAVTASFKIDVPASVKSYFVGRKGSFLDVYGKADIKYDNFNVQFLTNAGADRGVTIVYGKNLLQLSQEINASNLYTHIRCFYKQGEDTAVVGNKVSTGLDLGGLQRTLVVDVSSEYQEAPSVATLTARATKYKNDNNLTTPTNNIVLDFVQSEELANRVDLCDTVSVYYEALGITRTQMKCIRTKYDCLKEKYIETEFGDAVPTAVDTITMNNRIIANAPSTSFMSEAIARATELITGNLGGYVILHDSNGDGTPDEILIMDTPSIDTARKIWRWNQGGLGYSSTGYSGSYGTAITQNGQIVANYIATGTLDASQITVSNLSASSINTGTLDGTKASITNIDASNINTGTLNANLIKAGTISDTQGNSSINMTNGEANMKNFRAKNSFYLVDSNNTIRGSITYNSVGGTAFYAYNQSGKMSTATTGGTEGGQFRAYNSSATEVANLGVAYDAGRLYLKNGGNFYVENSSGKTIVDGGVDGTTGYLRVRNANAETRGFMGVTNDGGGYLGLLNATGSQTIYGNGTSGNIVCVSLTQTSSRKVKENIKPIADAEKILDLEAVSFDYKDKARGTDKRGFIAEDVAKILPNLVTPETEDAPACLDYIEMIPYLQAVIKKQDERIKALEDKLNDIMKGKED